MTIPHNTTAHVILTGASAQDIAPKAISFLPCSEGAQSEIGSGRYSFNYPWQSK